jgi:hypothetical protein
MTRSSARVDALFAEMTGSEPDRREADCRRLWGPSRRHLGEAIATTGKYGAAGAPRNLLYMGES